MARIFRGHPFIVVPGVVGGSRASGSSSSTTSRAWASRTIKEPPQEPRDRVAEIVFRFFFGCLYRHREFSGDPHPGNFLLQPDGRMAFLDFGLFKRMSPRRGGARDRRARRRAWTATPRGSRPLRRGRLPGRPGPLRPRADPRAVPATRPGGTRTTRRSSSSRRSPPRSRSRCPTRARSTSTRCATRRCPPSTSSAGGWSCSPSPSSPSCAPAATGTASPASGSTATRRTPSSARRGRVLRRASRADLDRLDLDQARRARAAARAARR